MRFLSLASGIESATVAWEPLGWHAVGYSENAKFPSAVLAYRHPHVRNFGDMNSFHGWPDDLAANLVVAGTPCQSFSVAGLRDGLRDPRGNLALVALAVVARYRPEWMVWENVPGVLSTNGGRDFSALIGGLAELRYGFAWRVLDAQHFGVPQRRRRVFLVGHSGDWRRAAAVLFERQSLSGHPPPREANGGDIAGAATASAVGCFWNGEQVTQPLGAVIAKKQTMPGKNRFAAVLVPSPGPRLGEIKCEFCGYSFPEECGRYGCPNCHGEGLADSARVARFLTPRECERLQGFPDDYTDVPYCGKAHSPESLRYRALGNSIAVPCMSWLGRRIDAVTRASLANQPETVEA